MSGFLLQKELDYLDGAVSDPKKPFAAIVGGSKVSTKITVIESLLEKAQKVRPPLPRPACSHCGASAPVYLACRGVARLAVCIAGWEARSSPLSFHWHGIR